MNSNWINSLHCYRYTMDPAGLNLGQLDLTSEDFILDEIGGKWYIGGWLGGLMCG